MRPATRLLALVACLCSYAATAQPTHEAPYVLVLGTAQDAGLPQIGCDGPNCTRAKADPTFRRLVASLLIADPRTGKRWLIDATPDLREQVERARNHPPTRIQTGPRPPLFDGIFLTHAHMGHYTGLLQLSRPAYGARDLRVYGSQRMRYFLSANGPWDLMQRENTIDVRVVAPLQLLDLGEDLAIMPVLVPHRDEYTDTYGFVVYGPNASLLYIPDIDKWEQLGNSIEKLLATVDIALLDGTFHADGEIPGRPMADIPHPFITESLKRFSSLPEIERNKIHFTHLNHTNPAADPQSDAAATVRAAGMHIAHEGQRFDL